MIKRLCVARGEPSRARIAGVKWKLKTTKDGKTEEHGEGVRLYVSPNSSKGHGFLCRCRWDIGACALVGRLTCQGATGTVRAASKDWAKGLRMATVHAPL